MRSSIASPRALVFPPQPPSTRTDLAHRSSSVTFVAIFTIFKKNDAFSADGLADRPPLEVHCTEWLLRSVGLPQLLRSTEIAQGLS